MAVNPKKAAKFSIGANKGVVRIDGDMLPLAAQTGFSAASDDDTGIPTTISNLVAQSLAVKVGVRYSSGSGVKTSYVYMTVEELGKGSLAKLEGKPFKGGVIRSAKVPQRAVSF